MVGLGEDLQKCGGNDLGRLPRQLRDRIRTLHALCFMCALVYNMMCVACCVYLCLIGYIWKTKNTRVREHDRRCSGTTIY